VPELKVFRDANAGDRPFTFSHKHTTFNDKDTQIMKAICAPALVFRAAVLLVLGSLLPQTTILAQGTAFSYQGRLNNNGVPATGLYDLRFKLFFDPLGNNQAGSTLLTNAVPVTNGLFMLGLDFGPGIFNGTNYWLDIGVRTNGAGSYVDLSPLQPLTPAPYAIFAENAVNGGLAAGTYTNAVTLNNPSNNVSGTFTGNGASVSNVNALSLNGLAAGAFWQLGGNAVAGGQFIGSTNNQPVELWANQSRAFRLEPDTNSFGAPNVIGGAPNNYVDPGIYGATIAGGGVLNYGPTNAYLPGPGSNHVSAIWGTISGGRRNTVGADHSVIAGGHDNLIQALASASAIGGGYFNNIGSNATNAVIAGGYANSIASPAAYSTIGGGYQNMIQAISFNNNIGGYNSTIAGGYYNTLGSPYDTIAGGSYHSIGTNANSGFIGGGYFNRIGNDTFDSTIAGGSNNRIGTNSFGSAIGGGSGQTIGDNSTEVTIAGGYNNNANGTAATIAGGFNNHAGASYASVGGGDANSASAPYASVGGGYNNNASATYSSVGGGYLNSAGIISATVGGGYNNTALGDSATVGGGAYNSVSGAGGGVVSGGVGNVASGYAAAVGGGYSNSVAAYYASIAGGSLNNIQPNVTFGFIGAGNGNSMAQGSGYSVIGGGISNAIQTNSGYSVLGGGYYNSIGSNNYYAVLGGGASNSSSGLAATVAGGYFNSATGPDATVGGGTNNTATGVAATVPGGSANVAGGLYSFAAGQQANAITDGSFVWADAQNAPFASTGPNQFLVRASGGVGVNTNNPAGAALNVVGAVRASTFQGDGSGLFNVGAGALGNYVFAYNNNLQNVVAPNVFQDITFGTDAQINGWMHVTGTSQYTNAQTGLYLVQYSANIANPSGLTAGTNAQFRVNLNGVEVGGTRATVTFSALNQEAAVGKSLIAGANAGDVLTVQFTGSNTGVRLVANSSLTISRIQ
jgi:hypothetical protein